MMSTKFGTQQDMELDHSHVTNCEFFLKFKMVDGCYVENRFLAITLQPIAKFQ